MLVRSAVIKNIAFNAFVLFVVLIVVKNNFDRGNTYSLEMASNNGAVTSQVIKYVKTDPRVLISQRLSMPGQEIQLINDRDCPSGHSLENRKRLRWVVKNSQYMFYKYVYDNYSKDLPYYLHVIFIAFLIWLSLFVISRVVPLRSLHYVVFLSGLLYVFQFQLSEISYTALEMLLISLAIYSSYRRNIFLLIVVVTVALHNRESGILLSLFWFIYNRSIFPVIASMIVALLVWIGVSNFDIMRCIFNKDFFVTSKPQAGQIGYWSLLDGSVSVVAFVRIIVEGYVIPFFSIYILYLLSDFEKKNAVMLIVLLYLVVFVLATPLLHHSVKLLLLPLMLLLSMQSTKNRSINNK